MVKLLKAWWKPNTIVETLVFVTVCFRLIIWCIDFFFVAFTVCAEADTSSGQWELTIIALKMNLNAVNQTCYTPMIHGSVETCTRNRSFSRLKHTITTLTANGNKWEISKIKGNCESLFLVFPKLVLLSPLSHNYS